MTKSDEENWKKRKAFENKSIDIRTWNGLNVEHQNTPKHEFVKFALTRVIYEAGDDGNYARGWDSEVEFPNGREADIVDMGPPDSDPVVYEVETDVTETRKSDKLQHFYYPFEDLIRDVIIIDPADVPDELEPALEYLRSNVVIG
jgi:hypothetical protein